MRETTSTPNANATPPPPAARRDARPACRDAPEDAPSPADAPPPDLPGTKGPTRIRYRIEAMDCPVEETLIRDRLEGMPGIEGLSFRLLDRILVVEHSLPDTGPIEDALRSIGMPPEPVPASGKDAEPSEPAGRIPWTRLCVAGTLAAAAEALELASGRMRVPGAGETGILASSPLEWAALAAAIAAILVGGLDTYRKGWIAVRNLNMNINALMSVAVTCALCIGQYPEAAMVMILFNLSEALESRCLDRARNAIRELLAMAPERATFRQPDGSWRDGDVADVPVGALVRVKPGERIALDGVVVEGRSAVNQAPITGESLPVEKGEGDAVFAGAINESGSFAFRVTAKARDSTIARIIRAVEEAQANRAPIERLVDRFARLYTPAVCLAALFAAVIPPLLLGGEWRGSIYTALVLLVIGCPCALVVSTPVSIMSGMVAATRQGILIKGGKFLELGKRLVCIALDKTGTITDGRPSLTDLEATGTLGRERVFALGAGLAARSGHPVSRAIAKAAEAEDVPLPETEDFQAIPGRGVEGVVDGVPWRLGSLRLARSLDAASPAVEARMAELEGQGKSVVALVGPEGTEGIFAVADTVKRGSVEAIRELKGLGIATVMLTGDNEPTARAIAAQVGVDGFRANLLPEEKLAVVEELARRGPVGMVGDGINDAPALAGAGVGFAMSRGGSDTAIETADVALMDDDLRKVARFVHLSRGTYGILLQNVLLAVGVKAAFFALALTGHATMWMAVFADVGACLMVVANGLRAMRLR
jgi:Cd2+/Zn2+-exporting ATPase